jgi:hypothetical protein
MRFTAPVQTGPGAHSASCTMGTGSFPEVKSSQGVTLTPHPLPVLWTWKSRAKPLLPLWAVRPVQSLSACTRMHFTYTFMTQSSSVSFLDCWTLKMKALCPSEMSVTIYQSTCCNIPNTSIFTTTTAWNRNLQAANHFKPLPKDQRTGTLLNRTTT